MVAGEDEQRVPDGSGGALPVISEEEGSIFLQSNTDLLKSNRFTGNTIVYCVYSECTYTVWIHACTLHTFTSYTCVYVYLLDISR